MSAFLKGIISLFGWMDCFHCLSPKERVDESLDNFYSDYPWIERDDSRALEKDFKALQSDSDGSVPHTSESN